MAPPLQALTRILHLLLLLLLAASVLLESSLLPPPPPSGGYSFNLKHAGPMEKLHHITLQIDESSSVSGIADTGSDLIWLKAGENGMCTSSDPIGCPCESLMSNMKCCHGHCMFERKYGEGSFARGFMVKRELETHQDLSFGCAVDFGCPEAINRKDCLLYKDGGIIGLGRGSMSLLSQLKLKEKKFSFCLPQGTEPTTKIKFGDQAAQLIKKAKNVVQLLVVEEHPSKYFVNLTKISLLGGTDVVDLTKISTGGTDSWTTSSELPKGEVMHIDSGSTFSKLSEQAFQEVEELLKKKLPSSQSQSHQKYGMACFDITDLPGSMPDMVLHFDTVEMRLPKERYMIRDEDSGPFCIAIKKGRPTLGNFQMQDMAMLFDLTKEPAGTLAFGKDSNCAEM